MYPMCRHRLNVAAMTLAFVAVSLSLVQPSFAIGISPSRIEMDFVRGQSSVYEISIVGEGHPNIVVSSKESADCGLSDYIKPEKTQLTLNPRERVYIGLNITLPLDYPRPGVHYCGIVAEEVAQADSSGVSAFSAVQMQIFIRVPYPERYLGGRFSVSDANLSGKVHMTTSFESMGLQNVTASAVITIRDSGGRVVATILTSSVFVESMGSGSLEAEWDTTGMPAGRYYAEAVVEYGNDDPLVLDSGFKIGDILVKIVNVTYPADIFSEGIVKLEVLVDSYWNDRIDGSYITLDVSKDGVPVGETRRSESFDLDPWESRTVPIYWDTTTLSEGSYDAAFSVHYAGREEKGMLVLEIRERQNPYVLPLILIIIVAIAIAVAYAVIRRKRHKRGVKLHEG
jgi:hypothetical protein